MFTQRNLSKIIYHNIRCHPDMNNVFTRILTDVNKLDAFNRAEDGPHKLAVTFLSHISPTYGKLGLCHFELRNKSQKVTQQLPPHPPPHDHHRSVLIWCSSGTIMNCLTKLSLDRTRVLSQNDSVHGLIRSGKSFSPPAYEVRRKVIFTGVCLKTGRGGGGGL